MGVTMDIFEEFRQKGLEEGLRQGLKQAAVNMHKRNFDPQTISEILDVNVETIRAWLKEENLL